jgi:hypothetical protein
VFTSGSRKDDVQMVDNKFRGKDSCIFSDTMKAGGFCSWNSSLYARLAQDSNASDISPLDRLDICKLCQEQSTLRSVSFIGTLVKELKDNIRDAGDKK